MPRESYERTVDMNIRGMDKPKKCHTPPLAYGVRPSRPESYATASKSSKAIVTVHLRNDIVTRGELIGVGVLVVSGVALIALAPAKQGPMDQVAPYGAATRSI